MLMSYDRSAVRALIESARAAGQKALAPTEARALCEAGGIPVPRSAMASSAAAAGRCAAALGFPVALKVVSPDILHKTEAGGVILDIQSASEAERAYQRIVASARAYKPGAQVTGVEIQQMLSGGHEVIVGVTDDPSFGKVVAFGMGGVLVEVLKDVTFRLAPATRAEARSMIGGIAAAEILNGVRGAKGVDHEALAAIIETVSQLATDFPEIAEIDLNPILARPDGAIALDIRVLLDFAPPRERFRPSREEILRAMNRIMRPAAIAVIGASAENGKIGNSVMKNLINGGFEGAIFPIHPKLPEVMGRKAYRSVKEVPGEIDVAVFAIPAPLVAGALKECGEKKIAGAVLIPSGFAETGNVELQQEISRIGREYGVRLMGPNIYGFYYLPRKLCATFCTPYDVLGEAALSSQSGGVGMAIVGFSRSTRMGVSAIVGLGNKADLDEDDLLTFFDADDDTQVIAMHVEDLKDGRAFAEVARRVSRKKPVIVLKAGRTAMGARAARSHTAALAGDDRVYDDILRQAGVARARPQRSAGVRALSADHGGAQGRERADHHRRRRLGRAALGRLRRQRAQVDGDAARSRRRVSQVHPAVRRGRQSGRHHRRRAAHDLSQHHPARTRRSADSRVDPRLLAHDHHAADGVRQAGERGGGGDAGEGHRQADRRVAGRRRRSRGGLPRARRTPHPGLPLHDGEAGAGAGRQVPVVARGRPAGKINPRSRGTITLSSFRTSARPSSCSNAARSDSGHRQTHGRDARRSGCTSLPCAPFRNFGRLSSRSCSRPWARKNSAIRSPSRTWSRSRTVRYRSRCTDTRPGRESPSIDR